MVPPFVIFMRFWGYIGCHLDGVILPLLTFKITGDMSMAGFVLLIEWLPKMFFYLYGGKLMAKIGTQRSHYIFDSMRVGAFLLMCVAWYFNWWVALALAAATMQICNALSNIVFEGVVSKLEIRGQIRIRQADLFAGLVVLPLTLLLPIESLALLGVVLYLSSLLMIKYMKPYYGPAKSSPIKVSDSLAFLGNHRSLVWLLLTGFSISLGGAVVGPILPFFIQEVNPSWVSPFHVALFSTVNYVISALGLGFFTSHSKSRVLPFVALGVSSLGLIVCLNAPGWWLFVGMVLIINGIEIYRVWARAMRQDIFPQKARMPLTGLSISIETLSYIFVSLFLIFSDMSVMGNLAAVGTFGLILGLVCLSLFFMRCNGPQLSWMPESMRENPSKAQDMPKAA